jgi:dTDP-4-amino-4,6-dideoxygalactose transaminase
LRLEILRRKRKDQYEMQPFSPQTAAARPAVGGGRPLFEKLLPIVQPELPPAVHSNGVAKLFQEILHSGSLTNSKSVQAFERKACEVLGVSECVAVSSCTSGLMLVLRCLELGGEVILPSFTFFASGHAVLWNGLEPVLVDCDPETFLIDPQEVRKAITPRTAAILAVHTFGNPAPAGELEAIAEEHGLALLVDAAHGFGARIGERGMGSMGSAEVFSLSPTKLLVAGEGGLIATNDPALAAKLRTARNYGDHGAYDCEILGLNARMTEIQAQLALIGLDDLDKRVARRNRLAELYERLLAGESGLSFQKIRPGTTASRKDFGMVIDESEFGISRDQLHEALQRENVQTRKYFYPPLHRQKLYKDCRRGTMTHTDAVTSRILNFPIYSSLSDETVEAMVERILLIRETLAQSRLAAKAS